MCVCVHPKMHTPGCTHSCILLDMASVLIPASNSFFILSIKEISCHRLGEPGGQENILIFKLKYLCIISLSIIHIQREKCLTPLVIYGQNILLPQNFMPQISNKTTHTNFSCQILQFYVSVCLMYLG